MKNFPLPMALALTLALITPGCVAFKHAAATSPSTCLTEQWTNHYACRVCVQAPKESDFSEVTNALGRKFEVQLAMCDAKRLADILSKCRLFDDVRVSESPTSTNDLVIQALPPPPPCRDPDAWGDALTLSVFPIYDCSDEGIQLRFVKGGTGDFVFPWRTHLIIGFWAPAVAYFGPSWKLSFGRKWLHDPSGNLYWSELRSALIGALDKDAAVRGKKL